MRKGTARKLSNYILVLPALLFFTLTIFIPVMENFRLSFTNWDGIFSTPEFVGLENYINLFKEERFYNSLITTVKFTVIIVLIQQAVAIFLAVILEKNTKTNVVLRSLFFIPSLLTPVVVGFIFTYVLNVDFGAPAKLFNALGMKGLAGIDYLGNPELALITVSIITAWQFAGYNMIIYIGALKNIPAELYESAKVDGTTSWQRFWNITLPLIGQALTINVLITLIGCLRLFDIPFVLTQGGPGEATQTIAIMLYRDAFLNNNAGYAAAESFVLMVVILVLSIMQASYFRSKEVNM